jgi:hypothetical protein
MGCLSWQSGQYPGPPERGTSVRLLFAEWLDTHILEQVGHLQFVFTIPKLLRPIFKYHPKDLGLLCKQPGSLSRRCSRKPPPAKKGEEESPHESSEFFWKKEFYQDGEVWIEGELRITNDE